MKQIQICSLIVCIFLLTPVVFAGSQYELNQDKQETMSGEKQFHQSSYFIDMTIDLWYEANINNDHEGVVEYEQQVYDLIWEDIRGSFSVVSCGKIETTHSDIDNGEIIDTEKNRLLERKLLGIKMRLFKTLKNSNSFDAKYKLLSDYQRILNRELSQNSINLAGN